MEEHQSRLEAQKSAKLDALKSWLGQKEDAARAKKHAEASVMQKLRARDVEQQEKLAKIDRERAVERARRLEIAEVRRGRLLEQMKRDRAARVEELSVHEEAEEMHRFNF